MQFSLETGMNIRYNGYEIYKSIKIVLFLLGVPFLEILPQKCLKLEMSKLPKIKDDNQFKNR